MSKHVLVVSSSPRKGQNTDLVTDAFIKGLESAGHTAYKLNVGTTKVNGCIHCMQCYKNGPCAQKDGMTPFYEEYEKADMVVFASPIYFWHINAQMKAAIDRMYALYIGKRLVRIEPAMILVAGAPEESVFKNALEFYNDVIIGQLGWQDKGTFFVNGTTRPGYDIESYLKKAFDFGASIK